jgi:hypothetical protein
MRRKKGGIIWENFKRKKISLRNKHIYNLTVNAIAETILQAE